MENHVLIVTNRFDSHADVMIQKFHDRRVPFVRFNTDDYPNDTSINYDATDGGLPRIEFRSYGRTVTSENIRSVWYRRPLSYNPDTAISDSQSRKFAIDEDRAFVDGIWLALEDALWVSPPANIRTAQNKPWQLKVARDLGFEIPKTLITTDPERFLDFWKKCDRQVIYKPIGMNLIKDENGKMRFAYTNKLDKSFLERTDQINLVPCLFQEYVPKQLELRITVVGESVLACAIHSQKSEKARIDWRHYDLANTPHVEYPLPTTIQEKCLNLVKRFGLRFGAIDMILTPDGRYVFLEINSNGQWLWIEQLSKIPISEALFNLLTAPLA